MGMRTTFIVTGVVAWLGGLLTALGISSCDTDTCASMDPDDPLCTPPSLPAQSERTEAGEQASGMGERPTSCDRMSRPSVYVVPSFRQGDAFRVVDVEAVWYEHEGRTSEARCVQGDAGCMAWLAGNELEGEIVVSTEHCDTVVSKAVSVGMTEDDCHVETEYLMLDLSTLGCLTDRPKPDEPT